MAILAGAIVSIASSIAYINSERQMPTIANFAVSTLSLAVFPGYTLSAYISNNVHDANLILAGVINFLIYGSLSLWLLSWRSRKKSAARPRND